MEAILCLEQMTEKAASAMRSPGLSDRNNAGQSWLLTKPGWVCLALYYLLSAGGKRQLPMWWSSLLHLNRSPSKARSPTAEFRSLGLFPLAKM